MLKVTNKDLREFAKRYDVEDITYLSQEDADALREKEGILSQIAYSVGTYGCSGKVLQGRDTGKLYVITSRTNALFMF